MNATYFGFFSDELRDSRQRVGYNPQCDLFLRDNYVYEELESTKECRQCASVCFTYRFTEADYEAAKAMAEAPL